ncbi:hypothetical protein ACH4K7_30670 [Streptomyces globisporus]|uniref:hypothetical protein n=1 Tax=Streptomyces globisporus TaxID=1908 RepID=UPI00378D8B29
MDAQRTAYIKPVQPVGGSGSGYLIGPRLVLTALHVVHDGGGRAPGATIWVGHPRTNTGVHKRTATVIWPAPDADPDSAGVPDVALLLLDQDADEGHTTAVRWGRPQGDAPLGYRGIGIPAFSTTPGGAVQYENLRGELAPLTTAGRRWVLDCGVWPAVAQQKERPWAGASGTAIFTRGHLVGVAVEYGTGMGERRLTAEPVHRLLADPGFSAVLAEYGFPGTRHTTDDITAPALGAGGASLSEGALGSEWLQEQVALAERLAEARYTPEHHVPLPLAQVADACALPQEFLRQSTRRARDLQNEVEALLTQLTRWNSAYPPSQNSPSHQALSQWVQSWTLPLREGAEDVVQGLSAASAASGFPAVQTAAVLEDMVELLDDFRQLADRFVADSRKNAEASVPLAAQPGRKRPAWEGIKALGEGPLSRAHSACERTRDFMQGAAAQAAEKRAWLLRGEAGQGKTHLLVDAARRAVDAGRPALVVFGQELSGQNALSEIAQKRGLGALAEREFLQAMDAAGAASDCRFLLIIDALNDAEDARNWKNELLALQGRMAGFRHIALVVSCRSTFTDLVVPDRFDGPASDHPGFTGREMEGLESYLKGNPAALPSTPLLSSVFTNPLFVKLYADGLSRSRDRGLGGSAGQAPDRSTVFDAYVDHRAEVICARLGLDPLARPVHRAMDALAARMAATGLSVIAREVARDLVAPYAPAAARWPETMLGQLLTQGLVSNERTHTPGKDIGIGFPYQAFGDDRVVRSVFAAYRDEIDSLRERRPLAEDSALRAWLHEAAPNYQEAASALLPEQTGTELIDFLVSSSPSAVEEGRSASRTKVRRRQLARSFLNTLPMRSARSVSERTVELLNETAARHGRISDVMEAVLAVTAEPGHLLNADRLHATLAKISRPKRDAWWGVETYSMLWEVTALHRLVRWAEQYPTPRHLHPASRPARPRLGQRVRPSAQAFGSAEKEAVRLAATTLMWTLTSSNRFLRDRATKGLVQLLLGHGDVLVSLLDRFLHEDVQKVDDPYLFERLVWVAYGVMGRRGEGEDQGVLLGRIARLLIDHLYGDVDSPAHASRNALLCDAATRLVAMAHGAGCLTDEEAAAVRHPHACAEIGLAPAEEELDVLFPRKGQPESSWGSVRSSLSSLGDFARYEIQPAVHHFSQLPLSSDYPGRPSWRRKNDPVAVDPAGIPAFAESLPEAVRAALSTPAAVAQLLAGWKARQVLDQDQYTLLQGCQVAPTEDECLANARVDAEWASRWVLDRVAELGWSPELFSEFDTRQRRLASSHLSHKGERIGKKYQWMALHELVERLANHHHPHRSDEHDPAGYPGAARLSLLDIDPSLPPARHPFSLNDDDDSPDEADNATFAPEDPSHPLAPPVPALPESDGAADWISSPDNLPDLEELGIRTDSEGREWIVLHEQATDDHDGRGWSASRGQAEQWHHIYSWIVPDQQFTGLLSWLEGRSLTNRMMPEGPDRHSLLLTDFPTVPGPWTDPEPDTWHVDTFQYEEAQPTQGSSLVLEGDEDPDDGLEVLDPAPAPVDLSEIAGNYTLWRQKQTREQGEALAELAQQWADGPVEDNDKWAERLLTVPQGQLDRATDLSGQPVTAIPTYQTYQWSGQGPDCSLDTTVSVALLNDPLLREAGLRRDPDRPGWHDADGRLQVQYLTWVRPSGRASTLLVCRQWLEQQLRHLGYDLVQGMRGERQTLAEHPRFWRNYSQINGHSAQGRRTVGTTVTTLEKSFR